jgi:hypothetical protein
MVAGYSNYQYTVFIPTSGVDYAAGRKPPSIGRLSFDNPWIGWKYSSYSAGASLDLAGRHFVGLGRRIPEGGMAYIGYSGGSDGAGLDV